MDRERASECKHGLRAGCSYCHVSKTSVMQKLREREKKPSGRPTRLGEKMNDRMTALKRRLKEIRGE